MMLQQISYYLIFGFPLLGWLGLVTLSVFAVAAWIGLTHRPIPLHKKVVAVAFALAVLHAFLGFMLYL